MNLCMLTIYYLIVAADALCDVCLGGWCHTKINLLKDANVTDQLAIDRKNSILYVQISSNMTTAIYLDHDLIKKMQVVQKLETSGLTVQRNTQELLTSCYNDTLYKIKPGANLTTFAVPGLLHGSADLLYFENMLYYTIKDKNGLYLVTNEQEAGMIVDLKDYKITDFVKTEHGIVFVANNTVYDYKDPFIRSPEVILTNNAVLATDRNEDVYLAVAPQRVIYKKDRIKNQLVPYAVYSGLIAKFVFDKHNNIIVYNSSDKSLVYWKMENTSCTIEQPQCTFNINVNVAAIRMTTPGNTKSRKIPAISIRQNSGLRCVKTTTSLPTTTALTPTTSTMSSVTSKPQPKFKFIIV